jgi:very-short-patch-repair endonuclease
MACGDGAVASHGTAAWLWGLRSWPGVVDLSVPCRGHARRGFRLHRTPTLAQEDEALIEGIPVTPVPRTLLDLAAVGGSRSRRLESVIDRAERRGLLDLIDIDAMLARRRGDPGTRRLRRALELYRDPVFNRARSERLFLKLVEQAGLPRPAINYFVAGYEVDAYWEAARFAVEVDGWETHRTRRAFELDRVRQEDLKLAGIDSIRLAARRIEREPRAVGERLRRLLLRRRRDLGIRS